MASIIPPKPDPRLMRALALLAGTALVAALAWSTWWAASRSRQGAQGSLAAPPQVPAGRLVAAPSPIPAPAIELPVAGGGRFSLAAARGQVVVVNLWATWCEPCVREMPSLVSLGRELDRLHPGKFRIVAVSVDEDGGAVERFFRAPPFAGLPQGVAVALEPGGGEVASGFPCRGRAACRPEDLRIPETYVVDQQGRIVALVVGDIDWSAPGPRQYLEALLAG